MDDSFHIFKLMFKTLKVVQSKFTAIFLHRVRVSRQNRRLIFNIATSGKFLSQVFVMQHQSAWHSKYLTGPRSQGSGVTSHSRLSFVVMLFLSPRFNHFSLVMFNIRDVTAKIVSYFPRNWEHRALYWNHQLLCCLIEGAWSTYVSVISHHFLDNLFSHS